MPHGASAPASNQPGKAAKIMKKVFIGIGVVLVLIVATIIAIPFFVPLDAIRDRIVAEVKTSTGRDLAIDGPVDLSIFPSVAVELSDVSLSNAPGASRPSMITLGQLDVEVGLLPLLSSEIVVQRLILREPVIALEVDEAGRANWTFDVPGAAVPGSPTGPADGQEPTEPGIGLSDLRLGEVGIVDGTILYTDRGSGQSFEATKLDLDIELESLDSPLALTGRLDFQGRQVRFALGADRPRALIAGGESSLNASLTADAVNLSFDGALASAEAPELTGNLGLSVPSIADLADWLALAISEGGLPVDTVRLDSLLSANPTTVRLQTATMTIDDLAASGDLAVAIDGPRPALFGRLAVDQLNLDPFLGSAEAASDSGSADGAAETGSAPDGWSEEPIDFGPLLLADADLVIATEGVTLQGVEAGPSVLTTMLKDGVLDFDLSRTALFGGHVALQFGADGAARTPSIRIAVQVDEVQAEPVLTSFADFERLTGTTNAQFDLTSAGASQRALVEALDGTGTVMFRDGTIKGINLAAMARNVASAFTGAAAGEERSTDFAELGASFEITDGLARTGDIRLLAPLLRMDGAGQAALPARTLAVRLVPKLVTDVEGQGGASESAGLAVPVIIEGPFDDLTYRPDYEGLITNTLGDPDAVRDQVEGIVDQMREGTGGAEPEDAVRNLLQGLTGGAPQGEQPAEGAPPAPDPADAIRSLLNR